MKVILPVAGKGTRLRPLTQIKAKSLVHVAGKTVLEHIISRLLSVEATEYIFITDKNGEQISEFMESKFPSLFCRYIVQTEQKGPAHAVSLASPFVERGEDILIVFNDTIFDVDLGRIADLCADCDGLIYSKEVEDYQRFGVNVVKNGFITAMVEKPDTPVSKLAQVGLYYLKEGSAFMQYLNQSIFAEEMIHGEFYLPPVFMRMIEDGRAFKAPEIDAWLDCGKPETLLESNSYLLVGRHHIHGSAIDSVLFEPVHIEKGAVVRGCVLGPNVSVAAGSIIETSIVKNSIINGKTHIKNMILQNSILGDSVNLISSARRMNIGDHSSIELQGG